MFFFQGQFQILHTEGLLEVSGMRKINGHLNFLLLGLENVMQLQRVLLSFFEMYAHNNVNCRGLDESGL